MTDAHNAVLGNFDGIPARTDLPADFLTIPGRYSFRIAAAAMTAPLLVLLVALSVGTPPTGADLEREAREIDAMLVAPCCFSQQVSVHPSAAAQEVKQDVRRRLATGQTRQQILDAYVAQYGKHILAEPRAEGFDLMLYVMPFVMLIASIALITVIIRRVTRHALVEAPAPPRTPGSAMRAEHEAQLDEELRDLD